jgi:CRISPR-associated protein Csa3
MRYLVASFGFDIDFVFREMTSGKFDKVLLLALRTARGFERVQKAFATLSLICTSLRVECALEPVVPDEKMLRSVYSTLLKAASEAQELELYLTGGPRMLVVALLVAALMLPRELAGKVSVVVEGEGFDCEMRVDPSVLAEKLRLDEKSARIVSALEAGRAKLSEIAREAGLPKSTAHRRLTELMESGLVQEVAAGVYSSKPHATITCRE